MMLRKFSQMVSTGSEVTVRKILEEMIQAGKKLSARVKLDCKRLVSTDGGPNYIGDLWFGSVENFDIVVKHFCEALDKSLRQNSYSYEMYQKQSDSDRTNMRMAIAKHFIDKYEKQVLCYSIVHVGYTFSGDPDYDLKSVYLLPSIFFDYSNPNTRIPHQDEKIQETLVEEISASLRHYFNKKRYLTLIAGYKDKNSFFSHLPIEVMAMIAGNLNSDESNCTSSLKAMK